MNYSDTIQYLYTQFPCFQQVGSVAYVPSLQNTQNFLAYLGNPEQKIPCIHVAGTNGKGSTSHFCASILQEAGFTVGLFTSPHLIDFAERIRVNGENVCQDYICSFVEMHKKFLESTTASLFEVTTAMAFAYFAYKKVDIAVIEVGLGGRLDSTNVITPLVSVITNIGFDHTHILGDTLAKIATEKAGIIKARVPAVIGEYNVETAPVFQAKTIETNSCITFAQKEYVLSYNNEQSWFESCSILQNGKVLLSDIQSGLRGLYQQKNILTAFATIQNLQKQGWKISDKNIKNGFANVIQNTNFMGRWQIIQQNPLIVCDTGHNFDGIQYTMKQLQELNKKDVRIVWGMVSDKDIDSIITLLPNNAKYFLTMPNCERAMSLERLEPYFEGKQKKIFKNISEAYNNATQRLSDNSVVYIGGSSYVVAEFLQKNIC